MRWPTVIAFLLLPALSLSAAERVVFETDSLYHHIIVSEDDSVRILRFHRGPAAEALGSNFAQSVILLADPYSLHMNYTRCAAASIALIDPPKRALFVGLGAGALPKFFAKAFPQCSVDVVELDPAVVEAARAYFFFPELPNLKVTVLDGRLFVRRASVKYDFIFLDAYRDEMIPFHLLTSEFLEEVKKILSPSGIVVSNVVIPYDTQLYPWVLRTYQAAFPSLLEALVPNSSNRVLVGALSPGALSPASLAGKARALQSSLALDYDLSVYVSAYTDASSRRASKNILTDDFAPVNLMRIRKADEKDWQY